MEAIVSLVNQGSADAVAGRHSAALRKLSSALRCLQNASGSIDRRQNNNTAALPILRFESLLSVGTTSQAEDIFWCNQAPFVSSGDYSSQESRLFLTAVTTYTMALPIHASTGLEGFDGAHALKLYKISQTKIVAMVNMNNQSKSLLYLLMAILNNSGFLLKQRGLHAESRHQFNHLFFMINTTQTEDPSSSEEEEKGMGAFLLNAEILGQHASQAASAA